MNDNKLAEYKRLTIEQLWHPCDPAQFQFSSTEELAELAEIIGQDRAVHAIDFGVGIPNRGFNIYVQGRVGTGRTSSVKAFLQRKAAEEPIPDDWCYVHNFDDPSSPRALHLSAGKGTHLERAMEEFSKQIQAELQSAFEGEDYERQRDRNIHDFQQERNEVFEALEEKVGERGFTVERKQTGFVIAPMVDGQPVSPEEYDKLPEDVREAFEAHQSELQELMGDALRKVRELEKITQEKLEILDREVGLSVTSQLIEEMKGEFAQFPDVLDYLDEVQDDLVDNIEVFKDGEKDEEEAIPMMPPSTIGDSIFDRYKVNVLVSNDDTRGAPVVMETNPTYYNLLGRVEHRVQMGILVTHHTMIKAGALHRANGGYLMLQIKDLLMNPFAWESLKRAIKDGEIKIEDLGQQYGAVSTISLEPEPIPLTVRVVLIGDAYLYQMLYAWDDDFQKLFKVHADFGPEMPRTPETIQQYALFIAARCRQENLLHFDSSGVGCVVEYGSRYVGDRQKLSARFGEIADLVREASYWASTNGHKLVTSEDVRRALNEKIYRANRLEQELLEQMQRGTILLDTSSAVVGQVNGLAVYQMGDYEFGLPTRITARTFTGKGGVIAVDREVKMTGNIHDKGVLILHGYLGGKYAQERTLSLSASITFEQSYSEIDGDSASSAELYAILSSLAELPLRQDVAVTGSVNQMGEIQPIGAATQKIEGFFNACKIKGLTGTQGVIIPETNVDNLMLNAKVRDAVAAEKFHIYPISTIDEGIEILTGIPAGELQEDGTYPENTVNELVYKRLMEMAEEVDGNDDEENDCAAPEEHTVESTEDVESEIELG